MFNVWGLANARPTRDIDLLGHVSNTIAIDHVVSIFQDICGLEFDPDGLEFDANEVHGETIKEDAEYEGVRITLMARLGKTQLPIQIDIGFADVITPAPTIVDFPTILDFPAPHLYGYPPEAVIAEKFQVMTVLGMTNSRMKDFYDVWRLADYFEFDGKILQNAIRRTFENRATALPSETHVVFSDKFAANKKAQWNSFSKKVREEKTVDMEQIVELMRKFFIPVLHASHQGIVFKQKWKNKWR